MFITSTRLSVCFSVSLSLCLSMYLISVFLLIYLHMSLVIISVLLPVRPSFYLPSDRVSACMSVYLLVSLIPACLLVCCTHNILNAALTLVSISLCYVMLNRNTSFTTRYHKRELWDRVRLRSSDRLQNKIALSDDLPVLAFFHQP